MKSCEATNRRIAYMENLSLLTILGEFYGLRASHVTGESRQSDLTNRRERLCQFFTFCTKPLGFNRNKTRRPLPLSECFAKKPSEFIRINLQSTPTGLAICFAKPLEFIRINLLTTPTGLRMFLEKSTPFTSIMQWLTILHTSPRTTLYV